MGQELRAWSPSSSFFSLRDLGSHLAPVMSSALSVCKVCEEGVERTEFVPTAHQGRSVGRSWFQESM